MGNREEVSKVWDERYKDAEKIGALRAHRTVLLEAIDALLNAKDSVHEKIARQRLKDFAEIVQKDIRKEGKKQ